MAILARENTDSETAKRVAPKIVELLAAEGVTVREADEILEYAVGIIREPALKRIDELRVYELCKPIEKPTVSDN
jgi:hypothetical protein